MHRKPQEDKGSLQVLKDWFAKRDWQPFSFQKKAWIAYEKRLSGLINAPTGSGKTYSLLLPAILEYARKQHRDAPNVQLIWITPIRALAKEIKLSSDRAAEDLCSEWRAEIRTGDTTSTERQKQWTSPPQLLITTPESIHVMMTQRGYRKYFSQLKAIIVDEWHELIGSKRGVQCELFLSRFKKINPTLRIWGISATIGNLEEAMSILLGYPTDPKAVLIQSKVKKKIKVATVLPSKIEEFPWAGHLGLQMVAQVTQIVNGNGTTLIFTNTRAQSEIWYHRILESDPELAGLIAMHHGSISREVRDWVEESLYQGQLKAVVCTSSLDLGVDFRPVDNIIQIGSPKGIARFVQRAGRSGHQPGATSTIHFIPTNSLEIIEAASIKEAIKGSVVESRIPYIRSFDVLIQYLMTLAVSEGFDPEKVYQEILETYSYSSVTREEWLAVLDFLIYGSEPLKAYDEYKRVGIDKNGIYKVLDKRIALRHKMSIGTITSASMMNVKYQRGKSLGSIEEYFISMLNPGDAFWFAGRALEVVKIRDMDVFVVNSKKKKAKIASYLGGRLPLSSKMSEIVRSKIYGYKRGDIGSREMRKIKPLLNTQSQRSYVPNEDELLVEYFHTKEGYHLMIYPFEGRNVHEGMAALIAKRLSIALPISFSIAMNDYGFELLSDREMDVNRLITLSLFSTKNLTSDIQSSINSVEMARRQFRDIARISGLIFQGFPSKRKKERHLQSSAQLIFDVFREYDPDNLLYQQTYEEVMSFQLEEARMRKALDRISQQKIVISKPQLISPLAFPLMVDRLRERLSSERLMDQIEKMKVDTVG